jgi:hypothetical protein
MWVLWRKALIRVRELLGAARLIIEPNRPAIQRRLTGSAKSKQLLSVVSTRGTYIINDYPGADVAESLMHRA